MVMTTTHIYGIYIWHLYYIMIIYGYICLVVSTPLKNISQLGLLFPIDGKIKNVPNRIYIYTYMAFLVMTWGWFLASTHMSPQMSPDLTQGHCKSGDLRLGKSLSGAAAQRCAPREDRPAEATLRFARDFGYCRSDRSRVLYKLLGYAIPSGKLT